MVCRNPCWPGSQCSTGGIFGYKECVVVRTLTRPFRLQLQQWERRKQCLVSVAAPQGGGWSLDGVRVRFNDTADSCTVGTQGLFSVRTTLRNSGTKQVYDTASKDVRGVSGDLDPMYMSATKNGTRSKVSSGQVLIDMAYALEATALCPGPDHIEGILIVDCVYVAYNVPPGGAPGSLRSSGGCIDSAAKGCNWFVPGTWCDCVGWASPTSIPGFGNIGCDTGLFMLGGVGLLALFIFLKR